MLWTKVTDALPPEGEVVIITMVYLEGEKTVWTDVRYNHATGLWEELIDAVGGYWETLLYPVTHWMPMPAPAEDE